MEGTGNKQGTSIKYIVYVSVKEKYNLGKAIEREWGKMFAILDRVIGGCPSVRR